MKKGDPFGGEEESSSKSRGSKARRVSFSATVNMKLFQRDAPMSSPPASPRPASSPTSSPLRPRRQLGPSSPGRRPPLRRRLQDGNGDNEGEGEEEGMKENMPPSSAQAQTPPPSKHAALQQAAKAAGSPGLVLTVPLKGGGSFLSSSSCLLDDSSPAMPTSTTGLLERTRWDLNESMDLTLPLPSQRRLLLASPSSCSASGAAAASSPRPPPQPRLAPPLAFSSSSPPTLSRTIILNDEDLDLTAAAAAAATAAVVGPARSCPSPSPLPAHAADASPRLDERTMFLNATMDLTNPVAAPTQPFASATTTTPPPPPPARGHRRSIRRMRQQQLDNDSDDEVTEDVKADEEEAHTVLLGSTMDLTSALDCSVHRLASSPHRDFTDGAVVEMEEGSDDATSAGFAAAAATVDRTQMIDQTMDLTTVDDTTTSFTFGRMPPPVPHHPSTEATVGLVHGGGHGAMMISPMAVNTQTRRTNLAPLCADQPALVAKLWPAIVVPELERKQWVSWLACLRT